MLDLVAGVAAGFRGASRRAWRAPSLTIAIVLILGLGLGGAAAIIATAWSALAGSLPYADPVRLVHLWEARAGTEERSPTSYSTLVDWRAKSTSFTALEGYDPANFTVGLGGDARMLRGARITPGFFRLLGVPMSTGRDFVGSDGAMAGANVAIVTEGVAGAVAGGNPLDRTIAINGVPHAIVGVLPRGFHFALLQDVDVFVPLIVAGPQLADRSERFVHVIARLRSDVTLGRAVDELTALTSDLALEFPDALDGRVAQAAPLRDALLGSVKSVIVSLLVAVVLLVAIMATNLALLMLTSYVDRSRELGIRWGLGATRARLLGLLVAEGLVPACAGAALAVAVGNVAVRAVPRVIPDAVLVGMPYLANVSLDPGAVLAIFAIAAMLASVFGAGPALVVTRFDGRSGDARATSGRSDRRLRRGLGVAQLAVTVALLVASTLLVASFAKLVQRDLGFSSEGRVAARAPLSGPRYEEPRAQQRFYETLLAAASELPDVEDVGLIDEVPGGGGGLTTIDAVGSSLPRSDRPQVVLRIIGGEYFRTMGIPVLAGRAFDRRDREDSPPAVIVSSSLARLLAPSESAALGRRLRLAAPGDAEWEVVGVVGNVQVTAVDTEPPPVVYLSHLQAAENRLTLVLRTELDAGAMANQLRALVRIIDPGVPVYAVVSLDRQLNASIAVFTRRMPMILCGMFSIFALALTLLAFYAISAHDVASRRREFAIRIAVGATPAYLRRRILSDAMLLAAIGVGTGLIVAALVSGSMRPVLFGISATDSRVYAAVGAWALACALLSCVVPAVRAGSVDPARALRRE